MSEGEANLKFAESLKDGTRQKAARMALTNDMDDMEGRSQGWE